MEKGGTYRDEKRKTQAEYLEKWYIQGAGMSAVALPYRVTGKEKVI